METTLKNNYFKFTAGVVLCLLVRLIPFRAPNIEPILATVMPFSKHFGAFAGFSFGVISILLYDVLTNTLGIQTFFTAGAYGALGVWSAVYFNKNEANSWNFVRFALMGTLFFDIVTGLLVGPMFFNQTFTNALIGQIPFTILHLLGNISLALILSPAVYKLLVKKKKKHKTSLINTLNPKII